MIHNCTIRVEDAGRLLFMRPKAGIWTEATSFESCFSVFDNILHVIEHSELLYLVLGPPPCFDLVLKVKLQNNFNVLHFLTNLPTD